MIRQIVKDLEIWKNNPNRKPLLKMLFILILKVAFVYNKFLPMIFLYPESFPFLKSNQEKK